MVSTGVEALDSLLVSGFPERSAILVVGPPSIGKEAICYWFLSSCVRLGDVALHISRHAVPEVLEDAEGYGVTLGGSVSFVDCSGMPAASPVVSCDLRDLTGLSVSLKKLLAEHASRRIRIVTDILSPLMLLKPLDVVYRFLNSLLLEFKKYDCVTLATLEEGMHTARETVAFEQLFDGAIEMHAYEEAGPGCEVPVLRVKKMRGLGFRQGFFHLRFTPKMELKPFAPADETLRLTERAMT